VSKNKLGINVITVAVVEKTLRFADVLTEKLISYGV